MDNNAYYLEFLNIGGQVKVMAIDPETGIEVSIVAPESASQNEMTQIAVAKLKRRILQAQPTASSSATDKRKNGRERGILV